MIKKMLQKMTTIIVTIVFMLWVWYECLYVWCGEETAVYGMGGAVLLIYLAPIVMGLCSSKKHFITIDSDSFAQIVRNHAGEHLPHQKDKIVHYISGELPHLVKAFHARHQVPFSCDAQLIEKTAEKLKK